MMLKHNGEYLLPLTEEQVERLREALKEYRDQIDLSACPTAEACHEKAKRAELLSWFECAYEY